MDDLKVEIRFYEKFEEWLPSYPGDPMVRPEYHQFHVRCTSLGQLKEWLKNTPSAKIADGATCNRVYNNITVPGYKETFWDGMIQFHNKHEAALFKLSWA